MSSSDLDLTSLRYLSPSKATQFFRAEVKEVGLRDVLLATGQELPQSPVVFEIVKGGRAGDFLWSDPLLVLASARVLDLFYRHRFTGYAKYPVEVWRKDERIAGYAGIAIVGRGGHIDQKMSKVRMVTDSGGLGRGIVAVDGLYFDPQGWDGSDIFNLEEFPKALLMVDRVWQSLQAAKVTNFRALPLSAFGFGYHEGHA